MICRERRARRLVRTATIRDSDRVRVLWQVNNLHSFQRGRRWQKWDSQSEVDKMPAGGSELRLAQLGSPAQAYLIAK